jgi:predicted DNA-binding transcriptional regulator YafY
MGVEARNMREQIRRAMNDPDGLVLLFDYRDKQGRATRRVVSPIRFITADRFLALCLSREAPRMFCLQQMRDVRLASAHEFLMPVPL